MCSDLHIAPPGLIWRCDASTHERRFPFPLLRRQFRLLLATSALAFSCSARTAIVHFARHRRGDVSDSPTCTPRWACLDNVRSRICRSQQRVASWQPYLAHNIERVTVGFRQ
jgi:hypothetical protein